MRITVEEEVARCWQNTNTGAIESVVLCETDDEGTTSEQSVDVEPCRPRRGTASEQAWTRAGRPFGTISRVKLGGPRMTTCPAGQARMRRWRVSSRCTT